MQPVPIVLRDEHLVVVDKPAGILVVPAASRPGPTLVDRLQEQLGCRVQAVHRLDEETTGVMLFALSDLARTGLEDLFRVHAIERHYLALLASAPSPPAGRIESGLTEGNDGIVRVVARGGVRAVTHYETLIRRDRCTLVRCSLETGRRNQIRVHMAALGCPVAGDRKYGFRKRPGENFPRVMLHSWRLRCRHPITGAPLEAEVLPREAELRP
ncbi:MAG: RluA family pseudouridine synthase [Planctomycetes bacterium]|nr:RluA family pseudouridine synthase [Planctomycetota bacterium]